MKRSIVRGRPARRSAGRAAARASALLSMLLAGLPASAAVQFTVTDLGTLGGTTSNAYGINAAGQVVGSAMTSGDAVSRAFIWQAGSLQDLGTAGGTSGYAASINAAGQVVGYARTIGNSSYYGFLWQGGTVQVLPTLGGTYSLASGINAGGQVVGYAATSSDAASHAALWQPGGGVQDLGTLGGLNSNAQAVNAGGQVVGDSELVGIAGVHAYLWQSGSLQDLGTLGGVNSSAHDINAAGQVVGQADILGNNASHAFLWQSGSMRDLGTLGGSYSAAIGINATGQVVGNALVAGDSVMHAFLGAARGGLTDLNTLLAPGSGATVIDASGLNDFGQIVGTAGIAGRNRAVLLTPTGSMAWLAGGAGGSFADVANWELGFTPNKFLDAVIAPAGSQTIYASADATVKSLSLGGTAGSSGRPLLVLQYGAVLTAADGVTVQATGTLTGDGTVRGNVGNFGTLQANNLSITGTFSNAGLVSGSGYLNASLNNAAAGQVRSGAGEYLHVVGAAHDNQGTLDISGGGTQQYTGTLNNAAGGRILLDHAVLRLDNGLSNSGQVQVSFGGATVYGAVTTHAGGKIILSGNSETTFFDAIDVESGAELRVSTGSTAVFFGPVKQRTGSLFTGSGTKFYEGGLSIGASPGLGIDAGDVNFGSGNLYLEEIGGLAAGTGFDKYIVAGRLGFGGSLKVVFWDGFRGQAGQRFDLFDWGSSEGAFAAIDLSGAPLAAGLSWDTSKLYSTGEIGISAVPEPQSWALMLAGLAGLARRAGIKRRAGAHHQQREKS